MSPGARLRHRAAISTPRVPSRDLAIIGSAGRLRVRYEMAATVRPSTAQTMEAVGLALAAATPKITAEHETAALARMPRPDVVQRQQDERHTPRDGFFVHGGPGHEDEGPTRTQGGGGENEIPERQTRRLPRLRRLAKRSLDHLQRRPIREQDREREKHRGQCRAEVAEDPEQRKPDKLGVTPK